MEIKNLGVFLLCCVVVMLCAGTTLAQTVSMSPSSLSFGIPTGSSPAVSAAQTVTVTVTGGAVNFTGASTAAPFSIAGNSCNGPVSTTCDVSVIFSSNSPLLSTGTLYISASGYDSFAVPLSGAYGAIKLFDSTTVAPSVSGASFANLYTIGSTSLNLSCTAPATAKLSYTPDGNGNVLADNYITLGINGTPVPTYLSANPYGYSAVYSPNDEPSAFPPGNVCQGSDTNPDTFNGNTYPECFSAAYRANVTNLVGQNTDSITPDGNPLLGDSAGGIPPLDISPFFALGAEGTFPVQATVSMLDAGGYVASSTLFLVTNCSQTGIVPGGTITGSPITGNVGSQTQTFTFDSAPGQNISFTTSEAVAIQQETVGAPNGVTPSVENFGISQAAFSALVANTSAGPAVCLRLTGEVDPITKQSLCKAFKLLCYNPADGSTSGDNCVSGTNSARNLYDSAQFTSPDAPSGQNFLASSCANFMLVTQNVIGGTCASSSPPGPNPTTRIGPGFLLGGDNWLTGSCAFVGTLLGDLCPLDTLTQFRGAADPLPGGTTGGRNTIYVPVVNMPLPFTQASIAGQMHGWVNSSNVTANFVSNEATYNPTPANPPGNGFTTGPGGTAAPPYSLTSGITSASVPVPDSTYPVPGDTTNYNDPYVTHNFGAPLCQAGTPTSFNSVASFSSLADGMYNLHYFTTDCALTEELLFNPTAPQLTDPTANWASFPTLLFGVDTTHPSLNCNNAPATPNGNNGWYTSNVVENCSAMDNGYVTGQTGSGFLPITNGIQGSPSEVLPPASTNVAAGAANPVAMIPLQQVSDLAGNLSNPVGPLTFAVDQAPPTIGYSFSAPGSTFLIGQNVKITYKCADVGSGVDTCNSQPAPTTCPAAPGLGQASYNPVPASLLDTTPSAFGPHSFAVFVKDCAGNVGQTKVSYTIGAPSADVAIFEGRGSDYVAPGGTLTYVVWALDFGLSPAYGVTIKASAPPQYVQGNISGMAQIVSCNLSGTCTDVTVGAACTPGAPGTISCNIGTLPSLFTLKGVKVKFMVPIPANVRPGTSFKINASVSSDNDPNPNDNNTSDTVYVVSPN